MENHNYTIYVNNRPTKVLFLINRESTPNQIDKIFKFNYDKWGGRYNPIVIIDGKGIDEDSLKFIREFDPDIIKSLVPINKEALYKINNASSPYSIEVPNQRDLENEDSRVSIYDDIQSIHPTPEVIKSISNEYYNEVPFITFDLGPCKDETIKLFITRNFGDYPFSFWSRQLFDKISVKTYNITDKESLLQAIIDLSDYKSVVFPSQLCSLSDNLFNIEYHRMQDAFSVTVGDDIEDLCLFWNNSLNTSQYKWPRFNQLWLPTELAKDEEFQNILKNFLNIKISGDRKEIQFISRSIDLNDLDKIASNFTKDVWLSKFVNFHEKPPYPSFSESYIHYNSFSNWDMYTINSNSETIILNEPSIKEYGITGQRCMVDVLIKYSKGRFKYISGSTYWWQLPKNNNLASYLLSTQARICLNGFPSVSIRRDNLKLNIRIPDIETLFHILITRKIPTKNKYDPRSSIKPATFSYIRLSDKGRYLSGLLDLFTELYGASQIFDKRYWRRVFNILSAKGDSSENTRTQIIRNKISKKLNGQSPEFLNSKQGIDWITSLVLQTSKETNVLGKELPFDFFVKEAIKEISDFNNESSSNQNFKFNEDDLRDSLQDLIDQDIILLGVSSHCPYCGYSNWHYIDDAKQTLKCLGCNKKYKIQTEPVWHYRLNNLVRVAYAQHGLAPVIIVLSQLLFESRSSFFFIPNIELYDEQRSKPKGELDILCIQDGKLIIGEVKQSIKLFNSSDFDNMKELAKKIKPDIVIFSTFDEKPSSSVKKNIDRINKELKDFEIEAKWYQIHSHVFGAEPYV